MQMLGTAFALTAILKFWVIREIRLKLKVPMTGSSQIYYLGKTKGVRVRHPRDTETLKRVTILGREKPSCEGTTLPLLD
jgi:hypothetical protein